MEQSSFLQIGSPIYKNICEPLMIGLLYNLRQKYTVFLSNTKLSSDINSLFTFKYIDAPQKHIKPFTHSQIKRLKEHIRYNIKT